MAELSPYALRLALYLVLMLLFGRMLFVRPGLPRGVSLALALIALAVVVGMLGLAALHRWRLVPALATSIRDGWQPRPLRSLRHSLACESVLAVLVLACVAVLGTLDPLA